MLNLRVLMYLISMIKKMSHRYIMLIASLLLLNGCDRGIGQEPVSIKNISDNNLTDTWILSKKYTDKSVIEQLDENIKEHYFKILSNNKLEYHSFQQTDIFGIGSMFKAKGEWEFIGKDILVKGFQKSTIYIDANGVFYRLNNDPDMVKPIITKTSIGLQDIYRFKITKKDGKLLLWRYSGDPDRRRYIMYEKIGIVINKDKNIPLQRKKEEDLLPRSTAPEPVKCLSE